MAHAANPARPCDTLGDGKFCTQPDSSWFTGPERSVQGNVRGSIRREARIASAIAEVARTEAACLGGARLLRIGVTVGADCGIDIAAVRDAFQGINRGTEMESVAILLILCPHLSLCRQCGSEFPTTENTSICPRCASPDLELVGGDELEVTFLEVERQ